MTAQSFAVLPQAQTPIRFVPVEVTPELARTWLARTNPEFNRPLKKSAVTRFAADMRAGRWKLSAQPVQFDELQLLFDGQHRLHAVVLADVTVTMFVAYDVPHENFLSTDCGTSRSSVDVLSILGEEYATVLAPALGCLASYERTTLAWGSQAPSRAEIATLLEKHPKLRDSVKVAMANRTVLVTPSFVAFAHFLFSKPDRRDEALATQFFEQVALGADLDKKDPIYLLRERLIEQRSSRRRLDRHCVAYLVFRTWNAFRGREALARLVIPTFDGAAPPLPDVR